MSSETINRWSRAAIHEISGDNTSGAAELLHCAAGVYSILAQEQSERACSSIEHALRKIIEASVALLEAQPSMAVLARLASTSVEAAIRSSSAGDAFNHAATAAQRFSDRAARAGEAAAQHAAALLQDGSRVLTHSRSSTVLLTLRLALKAGKRLVVIATESRPMMEGRVLALELAREGASVTLIADAAASHGLEQADFALLGADRITASGVINKIGTHLIALAARDLGKPVWVVCDTSKFMGSTVGTREELRRHDAFELWSTAPAEIEVQNTYFESTPLSLLKKVITEQGTMRPEEAGRLADRFVLHRRLLEVIDY